MPQKSKTILAVASAGGHWEQLQRISVAFADNKVVFATTMKGLARQYNIKTSELIPDCNADEKRQVVRCIMVLLPIIYKLRPDIIITTGALPGLIAIALGRIFGAKTLWIDSVANAEEYSMAGKYAKYVAHERLTQWPDVAKSHGGSYQGNIL
jgi:UDP-N-acetylglucosamine:LPS N-acetylglucosamine transferase